MNINQAFPRRAASNGTPDIPVPEIVGRLTGSIAALCEHLLPNGRRDGPEWRCGSTQGEPGKSLGVHLAGAKAGIWSDFADGSKGDPLDLIQACLGLDKGKAVLWAKNWLGHDGRIRPPLQPPQSAAIEAPRQDNPNRPLALAIWDKSQPAAGTPVEAYLRYRGVNIPVPPSIRYNPGVKYTQSGLLLPCMVAAVQAPDRSITAIHRTYIRDDGGGQAGVTSPKMALGPIGAGAVRLGHAQPALGLAEGVETALSSMQLFDIPVWAALGSRMDSVELPGDVIEVQIFGDNGKPGHEAAEKAAESFTSQGRRVALRFPPEPFGDWNNALQALCKETG